MTTYVKPETNIPRLKSPCIYDKLNRKLKKAMLAKDRETTNIIRAIKAKVEEYEVAHNMDRNETPHDGVVATVIQTHKKSLEKAVAQMVKAGARSCELVREYNMEIAFCSQYLPTEDVQREEIAQIVDEAISELGVTSLKQMGRVIGHIMKNNDGLDGKIVKEAVSEKLKE